jgi:hypothetical protein
MSMSFRRPAWSCVSLVAVVAMVALAPSAVALPTTPVGTFSHPGDGSATAVAVAGHHAYVTHACGDGCYGPLDVIDVADPARPTLVGTTPLSWGTAGIAVAGSYAYTTGYSANPNYLRMIDISHPNQPFTAAAFTQAGTHPQAVEVDGPFAYMVDYGSDRLEVIDVSDASAGAFDVDLNSSPVSLPLRGEIATDAGPSDVAVRGHVVYVVSAVDGTLQTIDATDAAHPMVTGRMSLGGGGTRGAAYSGIALSDTYAYVADANANALKVIDVSDPARPTIVATVPAGQNPTAIAVQGDRAFVTNKASNTLQVFDIARPTRPRSLGTIPTDASPTAVAASGHHVYVANATGGSLQIFDMNHNGPAPAPSSVSFLLPAAGSFTATRSYTVRFPIGCTTGRCTGRATLTAAKTARRPAATLGTARLSILGGTARTLTIHLNRTGRARLRATTRGLHARLTLTGQTSGQRLSATRAITLRQSAR